jgi:hypothetical protein
MWNLLSNAMSRVVSPIHISCRVIAERVAEDIHYETLAGGQRAMRAVERGNPGVIPHTVWELKEGVNVQNANRASPAVDVCSKRKCFRHRAA